jgi:hypothetical protein
VPPKPNKQVVVEPIGDRRLRKAALRQRQPHVLKKAMELSIMCQVHVRLTIVNPWLNELVHFESSPAAFANALPLAAAPLTNADYAAIFSDSDARAALALDPYVQSLDPAALAPIAAVAAADDPPVPAPPVASKRPKKRAAGDAASASTAVPLAQPDNASGSSVARSRKLQRVDDASAAAALPPPTSATIPIPTFAAPIGTAPSAGAAARSRKKLSVVIPDAPTVPAIPPQHFDTNAPPLSASSMPPLSALMLPPASASKQARVVGGAQSPLDFKMSPFESPGFFDRPSPRTRSQSQMFSGHGIGQRSGVTSSLFLPTPNFRGLSGSAPFADAARAAAAAAASSLGANNELPDFHSPK